MNFRSKYLIFSSIGLVILLFLGGSSTLGQNAYFNMDNRTVDDCEGIFVDSELGPGPPGRYDHNEVYTFHICIPGADSIIMNFSSFSTEAGLDILTFFDGPTQASPMIGVPYSGTMIIPEIVATSGCLTIHFESDPSINADGWIAEWYTIIDDPVIPVMDNISNPSCFSESMIISFDQDMDCDSAIHAHISIWGPMSPSITGIVPIACDSGATDSVEVFFAPPGLDQSGDYTIQVTTYFRDPCGTLWEQTAFGNFTINDCPIFVEIIASDTILCFGECTDILAIATGGDSSTYVYSWSDGLPSIAGPHFGCPPATDTYHVTVTDAGSSPPGTAYVTIEVIQLPVLPADTTLCQSEPPFNFTATPAGGGFQGDGIVDTTTGYFDPDLAGPGDHYISYKALGCVDSFLVTILPMDAGKDEASCPGAAPFMVSGFDPPGGVWSGPGITPAGLFTPTTVGSFVVTYTIAGCPPDSKTINVDDIFVQVGDTFCENADDVFLSFSPFGGLWHGAGLEDSTAGIWDPGWAGPGTHDLIYIMNGCQDTVTMVVLEIWAGWNQTVCPFQAPVTLLWAEPPGGTWSGPGIIDPIAGIFDPSIGFDALVTYEFNGCTSDKWVRVRETSIGLDSLPPICPFDSIITLPWDLVERGPGGGIWSGPGIIDSAADGLFDASIAGSGTHTLYYTINTCTDSMTIRVFNQPVLTDTITCRKQSPFVNPVTPGGGTWWGPGIANPFTGLFDPSGLQIGGHELFYQSPDGCLDSMIVTIEPLPNVSISGLQNFYCYIDTDIIVSGSPPGGFFTGPLQPGNIFNPKLAGQGTHSITYTAGVPECDTSTTFWVTVDQPIIAIVPFSDTTVCNDGFVRLSAEAQGGDAFNYLFVWFDSFGNDLGGGTEKLVNPAANTTFYVIASDGCSEPDTAAIQVIVDPAIVLTFDTSEIQCYEQEGFAEISVSPPGNYSYKWSTDPPVTSPLLIGLSGHYYSVIVKDLVTQCEVKGSIKIPSWDRIIADFITSPNGKCASSLNPEILFINQSEGGTEGFWSFGDGLFEDYEEFINPTHTYPDTGTYTVVLQVSNEGGCTDEHILEVCIEPQSVIYVPPTFSPDGDGNQDVFSVYGVGLEEFELNIFNRWGERIFYTEDTNEGWDGTHKYVPVPIGGYPYLITYLDAKSRRKQIKKGTIILVK